MFSNNSTTFFNFISAENGVFFETQSSSIVADLNFTLNFKLPITAKLSMLQAFELFNQFFAVRPKVKTIKKFGKSTHFNVSINLNGHSLEYFFSTLYTVRNSSRKKLVVFKFKANDLLIIIKDFITLFPFKIKFYDFHSWRSQIVLGASLSNLSTYEKFIFTSFFTSFFRNTF